MGNAALGRKQRISNEAWIETIKNIENIIPKSDIDKKVGQTVKAIKKITKGKKVAFAWSGGKDSLVLVDHKDKAGNIYGTVTHNRARGTHLLEPMKAIVKELMNEGKTVDEISRQLGMKPEEIFRLSDFSKEDFLKMMALGHEKYSKAEYITKI